MRRMRVELTQMTRERYSNLDPWQIVQVSRHPDRPQTPDYLELVFDEFVELHGDKAFGDDRAIVTGFARLAWPKGDVRWPPKGPKSERTQRMLLRCAHPEGYRKAMQKMEMASRFGLPIVCLIDTPGAYPGIGAEERGQAYNIAVNLRDMSTLEVPIICVVIGEGGSGGALGIGMGDHVAVLEFAYYSVISLKAVREFSGRVPNTRTRRRRLCDSPVRICWRWGSWTKSSRSRSAVLIGITSRWRPRSREVSSRAFQKFDAMSVPQLLEHRVPAVSQNGCVSRNAAAEDAGSVR